MRKLSPYLSLITILLVGAGAFMMPNLADAAGGDTLLNWVTGTGDFIYGIFGKFLWLTVVPLTGYVVWLTGAMIDQIITLSSDAAFYNSDAIKNSWSILRDVANMTFIFILIYNGLKVILNQGNLATIKKVLGGVLLAAIFINFSLFFTKAVIDVSNITAAWFVQGIHGIGGTTSVSYAVMGTLQMSKLAQSPMNQASLSNFSAQSFATGLAVIALNCVAAYVFFQVFFLLLGRLVAFMVLLVTAPIGFVGFLLPQLEEYGKKWWSELQSQAMLAPVFFLMLYIGLYIIDQTDTFVFGSGAGATDPYTGSSFNATNYVMFAVIITLLLKILDVSKKYSGEMGGKIGAVLKSATMVAFGGVAGLGSVAGRFGARTAVAISDGKGSVRERIVGGISTGFKSVAPTMPKMPAMKDLIKNGTWDIRNAVPKGDAFKKGFESILTGKANSSFGQLDSKALKERDKKWKEERSLGETEVNLLEEIRNLEQERADLAKKEAAYAAASTPANKAALDAAKDATQKREDKISATFYKTSNKDLEKLDKDGILTNEEALNLMSAEEIAHLTEKSELSDTVKNKIKDIRQKGLKQAVIRGDKKGISDALRKLSKKEKETLSNDILNPNNPANLEDFASVEALSADDFETILKSDAVVPGVKRKLTEARYKPIKTALSATPVPPITAIATTPTLLNTARAELGKFKEGEIMKMDKSILQDPRITLLLSPNILRKMLDAGNLDSADRNTIRNTVRLAHAAQPTGIGNSQKLHEWLTNDNQGKMF